MNLTKRKAKPEGQEQVKNNVYKTYSIQLIIEGRGVAILYEKYKRHKDSVSEISMNNRDTIKRGGRSNDYLQFRNAVPLDTIGQFIHSKQPF